MALSEGQVQVRDLVMGPGTPYSVQAGFNPWAQAARVDQSDRRSWDHGSWSGAEWRDEVVVPVPVLVQAGDRSVAGWMTAQQALAAAFAPSHTDIELRWCLGGVEYVMFGRPRVVEPDPSLIGLGMAYTRCAFAALDPRIYGAEQVASTLLPSSSGGLVWPVAWPETWPAVVTSGRIQASNEGRAPTRPRLVIYGPVEGPRVTLVDTGQTLAWDLTLTAGQWLDVETDRRTSLINGQVSRSGQMTSREWFELPPGTTEIAFNASVHNPDAALSVAWRSAW
ncbi:phage distal tail protein [Micromonospora rubida]|uniref:phage distal tail protein n=1 Tax=Micromonospora rubida TaxID=2697657 RepID=UPI001377C10F|nr:phage tail family protein [Micromonospora rubida]NBE80305.1 hypothetical protein [Micromonospora rubida]